MIAAVQNEVTQQLKKIWLEFNPINLITSFLLPIVILASVALVSYQFSIPPADFLRDPSAVANMSPFVGAVSNLGVFLWGSAATVSFFCWWILSTLGRPSFIQRFYLSMAGLTFILFLDDLFLLHENVLPNNLGISQKLVFVGYGFLVLGWLVVNKRPLLNSQWLYLMIAFFFLGASIAVDGIQENVEAIVGQWRIFLEDGFKFLGIFSWFIFIFKNAKRELLTLLHVGIETPAPL